MTSQPERGFLVLADISGFTAFVTATEIEHGSQVIAALLETVMGRLSPPLEIQELEGDAVFALGPDRVLVRPVTLLDVLESAFIAFKERQRQMQLATTCVCNACRSIGTLDLKVIAHYGSFLRHLVGGRAQVAGADVILAHSLLKNRVKGSRAYLLLTEPAVARTGVDPRAAGMREHAEVYESLGEVRCAVADLEPVWQRTVEGLVVRVAPEEALFTLDATLPVAPPVAWEWLFSPDRRERFQTATRRLLQETGPGGRPGVGTLNHCDHGTSRIVETILDWRPFEYCTRDATKRPGNVTLRFTLELAPEGAGTRVRVRGMPAPSSPWIKRMLLRALGRRIARDFERDLGRLAAILEEEARTAARERSA